MQATGVFFLRVAPSLLRLLKSLGLCLLVGPLVLAMEQLLKLHVTIKLNNALNTANTRLFAHLFLKFRKRGANLIVIRFYYRRNLKPIHNR